MKKEIIITKTMYCPVCGGFSPTRKDEKGRTICLVCEKKANSEKYETEKVYFYF